MSRTTNEEQKMNHKNASEMRERNNEIITKPAALTIRRTNKNKIYTEFGRVSEIERDTHKHTHAQRSNPWRAAKQNARLCTEKMSITLYYQYSSIFIIYYLFINV